MERFNKLRLSPPSTTEVVRDTVQPLVYVTYQAYLRRLVFRST